MCRHSQIYVLHLGLHRWASATSQEQHNVTLARADALLADWQRLMWLPGQRHQAWADIQQLFAVQQLPPISAAHFLISAAERLAGEGMLELAEQVLLVQVSLLSFLSHPVKVHTPYIG